MKNNFLMVVASVLLLTACKKNVETISDLSGSANIIPASNVPVSVMNSFNTLFPSASEMEWQHNREHDYECHFNFDNKRHECHFDDNGHESSHAITCSDGPVPAVVLSTFRNGFPNDNVYEWKFTSEKEWKAHFLRANIKWEVTISEAGIIIKTEHD